MGFGWSYFHPFVPKLNQWNQRSRLATCREGKVVHEGTCCWPAVFGYSRPCFDRVLRQVGVRHPQGADDSYAAQSFLIPASYPKGVLGRVRWVGPDRRFRISGLSQGRRQCLYTGLASILLIGCDRVPAVWVWWGWMTTGFRTPDAQHGPCQNVLSTE